MLKIRLQRVGRKHDPSFRIVLTDSKNGPKSGKFLEILGNYDAKKDTKVVNGERVKELISQGAQISDTVHNILISEKIIEGKKKNVLPSKSPVVDEAKIKAEEEAKKAKEEAEAKAREEAKEAQAKAEAEEKAKAEAEAQAEKEAKKEETPAEEVPVVEEAPVVAETTETVETAETE
ncbi:30S ribosomal protein S16 [Candidatus Campbellbacteria bacterium RIFCSPLOWO2_01_FULL_34_15]|uniref:Small ribosomal subunit protein bS16 n=2 Tax=Candidatus Campbelliibacteriota TaxID=1752727 RepID=A0A1F5EPZ7_9BACT|nr:MAG: 30S ribosomal protein S16 [Candidatus Campbellbacteria bacterium RIFCSPHIGHO2_01_FULL_34_10]OGD69489.1 MAG: 30S ribosomal protein S16 [Candidatus Campbellbacteria bacterium RIFCSPLOWO2_01_FULL_34_15]